MRRLPAYRYVYDPYGYRHVQYRDKDNRYLNETMGFRSSFVIIMVLFVLLVIVGAVTLPKDRR
ncbi:YjcZ family sporulation protein [Radiobacillus deserti]|uniref:YjcZ family sporulation protein n=1 Tax=Radiobacillus deserti TaxID=2594883 RepID=A0A516KF07_9BACI|nr:YjcZ family sporulation protein [Radiobacillus deserti]QDP39979.1 YjcZ family sporulation protein [Radiobacillus deserti]